MVVISLVILHVIHTLDLFDNVYGQKYVNNVTCSHGKMVVILLHDSCTYYGRKYAINIAHL